MNYSDFYNYDFFLRADGIRSLQNKKLKFGDAYAAVCYAHGISWEDIRARFPDMGALGKNEETAYTLLDQIDFVIKNKKRTPKKILEIGSGRGEVVCFLSQMGYDVVCIEPGSGAKRWHDETSLRLFNKPSNYTLLNGSVTEFIEHPELTGVDTVLMVESLEHILEEDFDPFYQKIVTVLDKTKGVFIAVNWIDYHPIAVGQYAPPENHCRLTDDNLYDKMTLDFAKCNYRNGSHLWLSK